MTALSSRLAAIVDALPLRPGLRVIEIGCGPGAAARAVADRVGTEGHVLAIDRSDKAIAQLVVAAAELIAAGRLTPRRVAAEALELAPGEQRYDIAFAVRVGAFDGRHPNAGAQALERLGRALVPGGRLFIEGGNPLCEVSVCVVDFRTSSRHRAKPKGGPTSFPSRWFRGVAGLGGPGGR